MVASGARMPLVRVWPMCTINGAGIHSLTRGTLESTIRAAYIIDVLYHIYINSHPVRK